MDTFTGRMKEICLKKGDDYANDDRLSNFKKVGAMVNQGAQMPILVLMATKVARLSELLTGNKVPNNESIEDSFLDLANYAALGYMLHKEKKEEALAELAAQAQELRLGYSEDPELEKRLKEIADIDKNSVPKAVGRTNKDPYYVYFFDQQGDNFRISRVPDWILAPDSSVPEDTAMLPGQLFVSDNDVAVDATRFWEWVKNYVTGANNMRWVKLYRTDQFVPETLVVPMAEPAPVNGSDEFNWKLPESRGSLTEYIPRQIFPFYAHLLDKDWKYIRSIQIPESVIPWQAKLNTSMALLPGMFFRSLNLHYFRSKDFWKWFDLEANSVDAAHVYIDRSPSFNAATKLPEVEHVAEIPFGNTIHMWVRCQSEGTHERIKKKLTTHTLVPVNRHDLDVGWEERYAAPMMFSLMPIRDRGTILLALNAAVGAATAAEYGEVVSVKLLDNHDLDA